MSEKIYNNEDEIEIKIEKDNKEEKRKKRKKLCLQGPCAPVCLIAHDVCCLLLPAEVSSFIPGFVYKRLLSVVGFLDLIINNKVPFVKYQNRSHCTACLHVKVYKQCKRPFVEYQHWLACLANVHVINVILY